MKKQNQSENIILEPEFKKDEVKNSQDNPDKNRIEFDTQEMDKDNEELELSGKITNAKTQDEVYYRPYKVSRRMSQKE